MDAAQLGGSRCRCGVLSVYCSIICTLVPMFWAIRVDVDVPRNRPHGIEVPQAVKGAFSPCSTMGEQCVAQTSSRVPREFSTDLECDKSAKDSALKAYGSGNQPEPLRDVVID
jgi:hypothetical protein